MTAELVREDPRDLDAGLSALAPGLTAPRSVPGAAILVAGPWLAGVSSLAAALRQHMPERHFVESGESAPDVAPAAVIFAVSAVAPLADSDCAVLAAVVGQTDLVIGALTKIDVHRNWRTVLTADAAAVGAYAPRLADMPWVGVAAAPPSGSAHLGALVELLRARLSDDTLAHRNRLRAWETHLTEQIGAASVAAADTESAVLHRRRAELLRNARVTRSERTIALRSRIQQARVQLGYFARSRCASLRTELSEDAAAWGGLPAVGRRRADDFQSYVAGRAAHVIDEVGAGVTDQLRDIAVESGLAAPPAPPAAPAPEVGAAGLTSRRLEMQLMTVLGAGFGLGVALAAGRLFTGLAPGLTMAGAIGGGLLGLLLTLWVVGIRGLLHDRAMLDRWVGRVSAALREDAEAMVATRVLAAEVDFTGQVAAADERVAEQTARQVNDIDARLRERAMVAARAASSAQHRLPALRAALDAVREGLNNQMNSVTNR